MAGKLPFLVLPKHFRGKPALTDFYWPDSNDFRRADTEPQTPKKTFRKMTTCPPKLDIG